MAANQKLPFQKKLTVLIGYVETGTILSANEQADQVIEGEICWKEIWNSNSLRKLSLLFENRLITERADRKKVERQSLKCKDDVLFIN